MDPVNNGLGGKSQRFVVCKVRRSRDLTTGPIGMSVPITEEKPPLSYQILSCSLTGRLATTMLLRTCAVGEEAVSTPAYAFTRWCVPLTVKVFMVGKKLTVA